MAIRTTVRFPAALGVASLLGFGLVALPAAPAFADSFTASDSDSLVEAIENANLSPGSDVITLTENFPLEENLPAIATDLEIIGGGFTIDGDDLYDTVLIVGDHDVVIRDLTIAGAAGHGIQINSGTLELEGVTVTGSDSDGLRLGMDASALSITDSHFTGNGDSGAWLDFANPRDPADGPALTITDSTFNDNQEQGLFLYTDAPSDYVINGITANNNNLSDDEYDSIFIYLDQSRVTLELSDVTANDTSGDGASGLYVETWASGTPTTATITGVQASGNHENGLELAAYESSSITVSDVVATESNTGVFLGAFGDGASAVGSNIVATDNGDGIALDASVNGSTVVSDSVATGNDGRGIVLWAWEGGTVTLERSLSTDNDGVGIRVEAELDSRATVVNSTVSGNRQGPGDAAAGIMANRYADAQTGSGLFELLHSTVHGNEGSDDEPQVSLRNVNTLVSHSIISGTDWSIGEFDSVNSADLTVEWSIIETRQPSQESATMTAALDAGTNLFVDPLLEPLADNGGPTLTHLPGEGSPAINAGNPDITDAPVTDQRGESRISGSAIDLGAVEIAAAVPTIPATGAAVTGPALGAGLLLLMGLGLLTLRALRRRAE